MFEQTFSPGERPTGTNETALARRTMPPPPLPPERRRTRTRRDGGHAHADPVTDPRRLAALHRSGLLDSAPEPPFDRLVRLAAKVLRAPVALVSLVDAHRQFFKSCQGLPEPWCSLRETPLSHSFCKEVVRSAAPLVIADARLDPRFCDNGAVSDLGVVAYAGIPLADTAGNVLGSFCVIDSRPRSWDDDELEILADLAESVITEIELRNDIAMRRRIEEELRESQSRVADQLRTVSLLNDDLERQRQELAQANVSLSEMATTDGLTGLKNRRYFAAALTEAHAVSGRLGESLSVVMIDVDSFKQFNDTFGHSAGDEVLRAVAATIAGGVRAHDLVARYGGEEFVILLPNTAAAEAAIVAERLRSAVENQPWSYRPVTASFGVATWGAIADRPWALVDQADAALYLSKRGGRNRVTHHAAPQSAAS